MAEPIKLTPLAWTQIRPIGFEATVVQTTSADVWLEAAAVAPAATVRKAGIILSSEVQKQEIGADATKALWARPVGTSDCEIYVFGD